MPQAPKHRALRHLHHYSKKWPEAWQNADLFRAGRGKDLPDWPAWCFLPLAGWLECTRQNQVAINPFDLSALEAVKDAGILAALGSWRLSQGIYQFDPLIFDSLKNTQLERDLPSDTLLRLPQWGLYVETPGMKWLSGILYGFFVHLEHDINTERPELRLVLDTDDGLVPQLLHIGTWPLQEAVDRMLAESSRVSGITLPTQGLEGVNIAGHISEALQPIVALVLYLCSEEPDIEDRDYPGQVPGIPQPRKTKKGWRLFPPDKPRHWTVGEVLGEELREAVKKAAEAEFKSTGRTVRPHLRKAHWHGFWKGRGEEAKRFVTKWLPPIPVNPGE